MFIDGLQLPFNVCLTVTCRPIGTGASTIDCIYVISVAIAYVTLIKIYLLTYLLTFYYSQLSFMKCVVSTTNGNTTADSFLSRMHKSTILFDHKH